MSRPKGFCCPREIIAYAVWAYHRFALSTADVEDLLATRGVIVIREAVRLWVNRFFKRLVAKLGEPRAVVTDKLRSSIKSIKTRAPDADHRAHKGLNNAIEVSHRATRKREKIMSRFKSHRQAQRFLSAHDQINLIFRPRRYQLTANASRHAHSDAFNLWDNYTAEMAT
ncbi:Transposase (plasmid) [Phaeobacter porticola]|uniref:Transposase n=2 Tax=Phaeobacter porticola TaxID=1844006 RepID=A0A1L3IBD0_9RHOB|nr:Transposase [Phaeobacter porticola]